ncbi:DNA helicase [Devosia sp. 63-57]|uniref:DNA helicase n=1 Tax=Devosia sp. 63-57 TaxID=1895751 RepID=UPI00086E18D6|nr:DNA helicase [Devosia sp. 63-57]ODT47609.1 MAG: DNA helicase [Pelagibacterium sp. SCN 63-126]OJX42684.1 MAG: DNA helicase [Devosia sp. 63-57]
MRLSAPIYKLKRRAKLMARDELIPLHEAQDRVANIEGFSAWSLLAARTATAGDAGGILSELTDGDMLLIAARPGHGKTRLALQLLLDASGEGRRSVLFTLEYSEREAIDRFKALSRQLPQTLPEIITSDGICADYIISHLTGAPRGTVAAIDYLQILDQQRTKPPLSVQMAALQAFARDTGVILASVSQIDRSYQPEAAPVPSLSDLRLPNPIPPGLFSKACFLNAGEIRFQKLI